MADKELIKEEIERIEQILDDFNKTHNNTIDNGIVSAKKNICKHIKSFIDSLPEEHNEDLEEEMKTWIPSHIEGGDEYLRALSIQWSEIVACHFAEWQKQKDFEELLKSDMTQFKKCYEKGKADVMKEMKETLQTEYEKGRFDMREEMMKDAVEGEVVYKIGSSIIAPTDIRYKVMSDKVYIPNVKLGDKVKIIIVKEEQQ